MRILVAPDKFRGSLTAPQAARAIARGARRVFPDAEIVSCPLADGGEGSLDLLTAVLGLETRRVEVTGPLRKPRTARYLLGRGRALIEMAEACGLALVPPHRRDPRNTTTIGFGELIEDALARGATDITLFLGGSSTNDGGAGMAGALGYRFFSDRPDDYIPMADTLRYLTRIDVTRRHPGIAGARFRAVCDVSNPLLGPNGATYTYSGQKGASPQVQGLLEDNMSVLADLLARDLGRDVRDLPGAGAAGGMGAGAVAFLDATLEPGAEVMMDLLGVDKLLAGTDLLLTGEGSLDEQTAHGKLVQRLTVRARRSGVGRVVAVSGRASVAPAALDLDAIGAIFPDLTDSESDAMLHADRLLEEATANVLRHRRPLTIDH